MISGCGLSFGIFCSEIVQLPLTSSSHLYLWHLFCSFKPKLFHRGLRLRPLRYTRTRLNIVSSHLENPLHVQTYHYKFLPCSLVNNFHLLVGQFFCRRRAVNCSDDGPIPAQILRTRQAPRFYMAIAIETSEIIYIAITIHTYICTETAIRSGITWKCRQEKAKNCAKKNAFACIIFSATSIHSRFYLNTILIKQVPLASSMTVTYFAWSLAILAHFKNKLD